MAVIFNQRNANVNYASVRANKSGERSRVAESVCVEIPVVVKSDTDMMRDDVN